jgi:ElaB/YqjD/DUF883 family membrane-anchored ribosome-binding protein
VSETDQRSDRIRERIAASQDRLDRDSESLPAVPERQPLSANDPASGIRTLASDHPLLTLAAGAGLGLVIGAMLPRRSAGRSGRGIAGLAIAAAELGLALSRQAADKAGDAGREGLARLDEGTAPLRRKAGKAGRSARSKGVELAGEAIRLAARLRK